LKRTLALLLAMLIGVGLLTGCNAYTSTLTVYNWGDYIDPDVLKIFKEENPGIKLNYEMFLTNEDMYTKLTKSNAVYDVIIPSDYIIERLIKEDRIQKLDFTNIPNYNLIDAKFKGLSFDPTNEYSVPYMWGTLGILYNKTMVDEKEISWGILFGEKYKGEILMMDSVRDAFCAALMYLGYSVNTTDPEEINKAKDLLVAQKSVILAYGFDDIKDKMIEGEAAVALVYAGDAVYAMKENSDLAYAIPVEGTNLFCDSMIIPKNSQNKENAELFINFMCRTDIAKMNAEYIEYYTPQKEAKALMDAEREGDNFPYPTDRELEKCQIFTHIDEQTLELYNDAWTEVITAK